MQREVHIELTTLLAGQHEAGREIGYDVGYRRGYDDAQEDLLARLDALVAERRGSKYDAGMAALAEARVRLSAVVEDVTPPALRVSR